MNEIFILDFGSGNTCRNDPAIIYDMIEQLALVDEKRRCVIKWQLFRDGKVNVPLTPSCFEHAEKKATKYGFKTTASVFDEASARFLLNFDIPFVKFANNPATWPLTGMVPRSIPIIISVGPDTMHVPTDITYPNYVMYCISKYPASAFDYSDAFPVPYLRNGISDHTTTWDLFRKFKPRVYECHYKLPDSTGLDAGPFARTPEMIKEILAEL